MSVYKDKDGTWFVKLRYRDWDGKRIDTTKRGFETKRDATTWETDRIRALTGSLDMSLKDFIYDVYLPNMENRIRPSTYLMKKNVLETHVIPILGNFSLVSLSATDILRWQDKIMNYRNPKTGNPYTKSYLKTINLQLTAVLSHAVKYYNLPENAAIKAGSMGDNKHLEADFWTYEEAILVLDELMDNPLYHMAVSFLYYTGCREGEMLALTWDKIDIRTRHVTIDSTYQILEGKPHIGPPKTPQGFRKIMLPDFLIDELIEFRNLVYKPNPENRIFAGITKSSLNRILKSAAERAGVKPITPHQIRHSHVSLLANLGFEAVGIGQRIGHKSVDITYRYAHMFPSTQKKLVECLENLNTNKEEEANVGKELRFKRPL